MDFVRYYNLESYLFEDVAPRHRATSQLSLFDLLSIIQWKSIRARTRELDRIKTIGDGDVDEGAKRIGLALAHDKPSEERFMVMIRDYRYWLPMASAILTVLDEESFTVYDQRVCAELGGDFYKLANRRKAATLWPAYQDYMHAVREATPTGLSLRDCDRWLWARNAARGLEQVITTARQGMEQS